MCRAQRAHRGQARGLGAPRLDLQRAGRRRAPPLGGAERRRARLGRTPTATSTSRRRATTCPACTRRCNALGVIPTERLLRLRRLGGLDGHPDVGVPGIEANSGSLGMGISKGRGIAWAKRHLGRGGRVVVMVGDGELQEGQNWEALQAAAHQRVGRLSWSSTATSSSRTSRPRRSSRSGPRGEAPRVRLARRDLRRARPRRAARARSRAFRGGRRASAGARRAHDQGEGRVVHGASRRARAPAAGRTAGTRARPTTRRSSGPPPSSRDGSTSGSRRSASTPLAARARRRRSTMTRAEPRGRAREGRGAPASSERQTRRVRRRRLWRRRSSSSAARDPRARRARRRPRLRLPRPRVRARVARALRRERDRRAGHGLDGGRARAARAAPRRQLVRELPRLARERADLQPGERADEGRLCDALRGPDPGGAREVAPEPARRVAPRRDPRASPSSTPATPRRRAPSSTGRSTRRRRASPIRLAIGPSPRRSSCPTATASRRARRHAPRGRRRRCSSRYGPVMLHEALTAARAARRAGVDVGVVAMPWLNRVDPAWLAATFQGVRRRPRRRGPRARRRPRRRAPPRVAALRARAVDVVGVEGWPACGTPVEALAHPRARRRLARRAHRARARRSRRGRETSAGLARPRRPALDPGLRRLRDRRPARATARRTALRRVSRSASRRASLGPRGSPRVARASTRDLLPRRSVGSGERGLRRVDRWLDRADRLLPARDPPQPSSRVPPRAHARRGTATPARLVPGRPAAALRPRIERAMRRVALLATPLRARSALRARLRASAPRSSSRTSRCSPAVPFLVAARRLGLPLVGYVASWDHTVGKGVISPPSIATSSRTRSCATTSSATTASTRRAVVVTGWPQTRRLPSHSGRARRTTALLAGYGLDPGAAAWSS